MRRLWLGSAVLFFAMAPAGAQTPPTEDGLRAGLLECSAILVPELRLECFDALAAETNPPVPAPPPVADDAKPVPAPVGAWVHTADRDAMTDFPNTYWRLESTNQILGVAALVRATLFIRCQRDTTDVYVNWRQFVDTGDRYDQHPVTIRIGSQTAQQQRWSMSTDYEATFAPQAIALLRALRGAETFLIETTPYGDSPVRAEFNLQGFDEVIADVSSTCHWSP